MKASLYIVGAVVELGGILLVASPDLVPGSLRFAAWARPRLRRLENRIRRLIRARPPSGRHPRAGGWRGARKRICIGNRLDVGAHAGGESRVSPPPRCRGSEEREPAWTARWEPRGVARARNRVSSGAPRGSDRGSARRGAPGFSDRSLLRCRGAHGRPRAFHSREPRALSSRRGKRRAARCRHRARRGRVLPDTESSRG
jgi:hypothetical protein